MYAKLFTSIYQGTLRGNSHGLLVFTNLLAHCDSAGVADIHPRAIAEEVGLTIPEVKEALLMLEQPDPDSRSPEEEGRRITRMDEHRDWGWLVVNYAKYRAIRSADDRREQNRLAQDRWRAKQATTDSKQSKPRKPPSAQAEAEAEASNSTTLAPRGARLPQELWDEVVAFYGGLCAYCEKAPWTEMDHVQPTSRGGKHEIANVVPSCKSCNSSKRDRLWEVPRQHPFMLPNEKKAPPPRAARLPADWTPSDGLLAWTAIERKSWDKAHYAKVLASFRDHWKAKAGKDGCKLDWDATWRNWVRKEPELKTSAPITEKPWYLTSAGIQAKGMELQFGAWDEIEPFPAYRDRVFLKAKITPEMLRKAKLEFRA